MLFNHTLHFPFLIWWPSLKPNQVHPSPVSMECQEVCFTRWSSRHFICSFTLCHSLFIEIPTCLSDSCHILLIQTWFYSLTPFFLSFHIFLCLFSRFEWIDWNWKWPTLNNSMTSAWRMFVWEDNCLKQSYFSSDLMSLLLHPHLRESFLFLTALLLHVSSLIFIRSSVSCKRDKKRRKTTKNINEFLVVLTEKSWIHFCQIISFFLPYFWLFLHVSLSNFRFMNFI